MKTLYENLLRIEPFFVILIMLTMCLYAFFLFICFSKNISAENAIKQLKKTDSVFFIGATILTVFFATELLLEFILGYRMSSIVFLIASMLLAFKCKAELNNTKEKEKQYLALIDKNQDKEKWIRYWRGDRV